MNSAERILSYEEALQVVVEHARRLRESQHQVEQCLLLDSIGRTLAENVVADRDFPPFDRATRDGYAVRNADVQGTPATLSVVGQIRAGGDLPDGFSSLRQGEALSIMTGAPVPVGADAVVMVEYTQSGGRQVRVLKSVAAGENIVPRGSEGHAGARLIESGTLVSHPEIALAASVGKSAVSVFAKPRIAILPTGDEIVSIDSTPAANQIRNSNSFSLAAQVLDAGGVPIQLPIAADDPARLREVIEEGLSSDLLLLSGGVSAGQYDLVEDVLAGFDAEFFFTGAQIQPGKPLIFGRARRDKSRPEWTYFFGLPGNPISTMVTFTLFARLIVRALSGAAATPSSGTRARLAKSLRFKPGLTRFLPALLSGTLHNPEIELVPWQGSGDVAAFARANCLLVVPPDREALAAGDLVTTVPL